MIADGNGIPLAAILTGGNRNDVTQLMPLLAAIPPVRHGVGRPRRRPAQVFADRGYDHDKYRRLVRAKNIKPVIARRGTEHGSGLGVVRWVIERTTAGTTACAGCASVTSAATTSTKPFSASLPASSPCATSYE